MFAYALIHSHPPEVVFAENGEALSEILAREFISQLPSSTLGSTQLMGVRRALLERRWADALVAWIAHTGVRVDVFDSVEIPAATHTTRDSYYLAIQTTPIFRDQDA